MRKRRFVDDQQSFFDHYDRDEAEFWDRPLDQVHADMIAPLDLTFLDPDLDPDLHPDPVQAPEADEQSDAFNNAYMAEWLSLTDSEQSLISILSPRVLLEWRKLAPEEREQRLDARIAWLLRTKGPEAFTMAPVLKHSAQLWQTSRTGATASIRKAARQRLECLLRVLLPDLRRTKDSVDLLALAKEADESWRRLKTIRRQYRRSVPALRLAIKEAFPAPPRLIDGLLRALTNHGRGESVRHALYRIVGLKFSLKAGALPELIAEGRKLAAERAREEEFRRRAQAGRERYERWLKEQPSGNSDPP